MSREAGARAPYSRLLRRYRSSQTPSAMHRRYTLLATVTTEIIFWTDQATLRILDANAAALAAYGYTLEEFRRLTVADLRAPGTRPAIAKQIAETAVASGTMFETWHIRKNGEIFPVEVVAQSAPLAGRRVIVSTVRDISERRRAAHHAERLIELWRLATDTRLDEESRLQAMLDASAAALRPGGNIVARLSHVEGAEIVVDAVTRTAPTAGAREATARLDPPGTRIPCEQVLEADVLAAAGVVGWDDLVGSPTAQRRGRDRAAGWKRALGCAIRVGESAYVLLFLAVAPAAGPLTPSDETFVEVLASFFGSRLAQERLRRQLRHSAQHDRLTALPNRAWLRQVVNRELATGRTCALAMIGLDDFREVNDAIGHQRADAVLVEVAAAMRRAAVGGESIARLDGDTFGVFLCAGDRRAALQRAAAWRSVFERPFGTGDREGHEFVRLSAAVGIAISPTDGMRFEDLLANAGAALSTAKDRGRGSVATFDPEIKRAVDDRRTLAVELRSAIDGDEFEMYYQPTVALHTMRVTGAEALIRWNHPVRGLLGPDEFVPFAHRTGLMDEIDRWVLQHTVADLVTLRDLAPDFRCYCNISAGSIGDAEVTARIAELLADHPGTSRRLGVEITESAAMQDVARTTDALAELRSLGVKIAIDDFGTGFSSLAYLTRFPVDVVKIDRSFVSGISGDPRDRTLIRTLLAMATQLGFGTVAEGVETDAELAWLRGTTCTMAQGYLIARPMPPAALVGWLAERGGLRNGY